MGDITVRGRGPYGSLPASVRGKLGSHPKEGPRPGCRAPCCDVPWALIQPRAKLQPQIAFSKAARCCISTKYCHISAEPEL